MTEKQHEKQEQKMLKIALQLQDYCSEYAGYCNCGDDGRPCIFYDVDKYGEDRCWLDDHPRFWYADVLSEKRGVK